MLMRLNPNSSSSTLMTLARVTAAIPSILVLWRTFPMLTKVLTRLCSISTARGFKNKETSLWSRLSSYSQPYLVSQNLRGRQVVHLSTRHWVPQSSLRADISHPHCLWWIGELPFPLYGYLGGWCARSVVGTDSFGKDTTLTYDKPCSLLGDDGRWLFSRHQ